MARTDILTPVGRLVQGSLYKGRTTDAEGKPLVTKTGPNAGQARTEFYFALAIPKGAETHWSQTPWGQIIFNTGRTAFPQQHAAPTFAWKVKDGDSAIPNRRGKAPKDTEGFPGHWVLSFSSGVPPKISRDNGTVPMPEPDAVNLGDYVQVFGNVDGNGSAQQPGLFLNHSLVNFAGYGQRIIVGPDAASVGFGQGVTLPAGASATPPAAAWTPGPVAAPLQPGGAPAGYPVPPTAAVLLQPMAPLPSTLPAPTAVAPAPAFLAPPVVPAMPAVPPAAPVRQMTAKAAGQTYEAFIAGGWNDQQLIQHGYMVG